MGTVPKSASGIHIGVYKYPRALYTNLTHSLKYFHAMLYIEENQGRKRLKTRKDPTTIKLEGFNEGIPEFPLFTLMG